MSRSRSPPPSGSLPSLELPSGPRAAAMERTASDIAQRSRMQYQNISADGSSRQINGNIYENHSDHHAGPHYHGDTYYMYPTQQQRADDSLTSNQRNRELLRAAGTGQRERVRHLLKTGASIEYSNKKELKALHYAAFSGNHSIVLDLVGKFADINACSKTYGTPLCLAAFTGQTEVVRTLLDRNAKIDFPCGVFGSVLHAACWTNNVDIVKMLSESDKASVDQLRDVELQKLQQVSLYRLLSDDEAGADGEQPIKRRSSAELMNESNYSALMDISALRPLTMSVLRGHLEVVECLLSKGAQASGSAVFKSLEVKDPSTRTDGAAFIMAITGDRVAILGKLVLRVSSEFVLRGSNLPLMPLAAQLGRSFCLEMLIVRCEQPQCQKGALLSAVEGNTPGHFKCAKLLIDMGLADLEFPHGQTGRAALSHAAYTTGRRETLQLLVESGANVNAVDTFGRSALFAAIDSNHLTATAYLLTAGADVNHEDNAGRNAAVTAILAEKNEQMPSNASQPFLKLFFEYGANVRFVDSEDYTLLHYAVTGCGFEVIKMLVEAGADVLGWTKHRAQASDIAKHCRKMDDCKEVVAYLTACEKDRRKKLYGMLREEVGTSWKNLFKKT